MNLSIESNEDVLYRYEEVRYSLGVDQFDDPLPGYTLKISLREIPVLKRTPKGAWVRRQYYTQASENDRQFIRLTARKQYASNTKEEAKECFIARKKRQIQILSGQLEQAKEALALGEDDGRRSMRSVW